MITFLKKYANDSFEKLVNEIQWFDLPFRLKAIFSKLPSSGGDSRPYKVYTALLNQSRTDAPVATVLENTLGDIVWSRDSEGIYNAELNGAFMENKTFGIFNYSLSQGDEIFMTIENLDINIVQLINRTSTSAVQDTFSGQIEIRVYN